MEPVGVRDSAAAIALIVAGHVIEIVGWCGAAFVVGMDLLFDDVSRVNVAISFALPAGIACAGRSMVAAGRGRSRTAQCFAIAAVLACATWVWVGFFPPAWIVPDPPRVGEPINSAGARLREHLVPFAPGEGEGVLDEGEGGFWYRDPRGGDRTLVIVHDGRIVRVSTSSR